MSYKEKGTVKVILPEVSGTSAAGKDWKKQSFVIETTDENYQKQIAFEIFNDKNDIFSKMGIGSEVEVSFSVESREYQGKYFSNVNAFKVEILSGGTSIKTPAPTEQPNIPPDKDDLPF